MMVHAHADVPCAVNCHAPLMSRDHIHGLGGELSQFDSGFQICGPSTSFLMLEDLFMKHNLLNCTSTIKTKQEAKQLSKVLWHLQGVWSRLKNATPTIFVNGRLVDLLH